MTDLSIVVPWRGGESYREASCAFVVTWLRHVFPDASLELADDGGIPFARGASIDAAVADAPADIVIVCDADILVPAAQLRQAVHLAADSDGQVLPFESYRYLTGAASEALRAGPVDDNGWPGYPDEWTYAVAVGASCVFSKTTHEKAGGHPGFRGWGMEDVAFYVACETLVAPCRRVPGDVLHLWHPTPVTDYRDERQMAENVRLLEMYGGAAGDPEAMAALVDALRNGLC